MGGGARDAGRLGWSGQRSPATPSAGRWRCGSPPLAPEHGVGAGAVLGPALELEPSPELTAVWEAEEAALDGVTLEAAVEAVLDGWLLPEAPPALTPRVARMQRQGLRAPREAGAAAEEPPDPLEERPDAGGTRGRLWSRPAKTT